MRDNIWASIEVFNNVHPRLGGLDTVMTPVAVLATYGDVHNMLSRTSSNTVRPNCCSHCTKSFASAGKKELYLRTRGTPRSLPYTITRVRGKLANFWKSQTGRLVRATKIAISVSRQNARRATTKSPGSTMVKNNSFITGMMNSNHIQIK